MPNEDLNLFETDEDDSSASGTVQVSLASHLEGVGEFARRFASGCDLPSNLIEVIARAGLFHDTGKADPRFQALLRGGNPWVGGELLANRVTSHRGDWPTGRHAKRPATRLADVMSCSQFA